jgi:hypothetical protein
VRCLSRGCAPLSVIDSCGGCTVDVAVGSRRVTVLPIGLGLYTGTLGQAPPGPWGLDRQNGSGQCAFHFFMVLTGQSDMTRFARGTVGVGCWLRFCFCIPVHGGFRGPLHDLEDVFGSFL